MAENTRVKRQVAAQPTYNQPRYGQAYVVRGGDIGHDTRQLVKGLSTLEPALTGVLDDYQERQSKTQAAKDFAEGKEPQSGHGVYLDAYDQLDAMDKATDFAKQLTAWANDPNMDVQTFEKNVSQGLQSQIQDQEPGFVRRFVPQAMQYVKKADATFTDKQRERERNTNLTKIAKTMAGVVEGRMHFTEGSPEETAKVFKKYADTLRKNGKQLGLSPKEVSEAILDRIGYMAVENGRPDLLDYVKIKDSGVSVEDAFPGKVFQYRTRAQNVREQMDKDTETARDNWLKQERHKSMNNIMIEMSEMDTSDIKSMNNLRSKLYGMKNSLTATQFRPLLNSFNALRENIEFGQRTDQRTWAKMYTAARQGTLSWNMIEDNLGNITSEDFREIIKAQAQTLSTSYDKTASEDRRMDNEALSPILKKVLRFEFGDEEGYGKQDYIQMVYFEKKEEWRKENPDKYLGKSARRQLAREAHAEVETWEGIDFGSPMPVKPGQQKVTKPVPSATGGDTGDLDQEAERLLGEVEQMNNQEE